MRKVFSVALMAAMVCLVGMTKDAGAAVTFSLVWTGTTGTGITGTSDIAAGIGDVLTLSIRMTTDQTLGGHGVSLAFDTDLGNELNLFNPNGAAEWAGSNFGTTAMATNYSPINVGVGPPPAVDSTGGAGGSITLIESGQITGTLFLPVGTYTVGTARFVANGALNPQGDGNDVFVGLFGGGDAVLNNAFGVIPIGSLSFLGASVNSAVIPEPGTASLLGLGLVGLVLAGRRSRR